MTSHETTLGAERRNLEDDTVGAVIADMLVAAGCRHYFLLTGGDNAFFGELMQRGVKMVLARSERSAAFMADAYARLTGRPSFVYGQFGPGATVVVSGLIDARLANTPVVVIASEAKTDVIHRSSYQEVDQQALFRPLVKWLARLERADRTPDLLRSALREAVVGCPGPTYLGVPNDVMLLPAGVPEEARWVDQATVAFPAHRPAADPTDIERVASLLRLATRPIILAGGGTVLSEAYDGIAALAEELGIPVVTTASGKGAIAETHELAIGVAGRYSRTVANRLLREADAVLAIGTRLNDMTTNRGRAINPDAAVAQVDVDPTTVGLNWRLDAAAIGDAAAVLRQIHDAITDDCDRLRRSWEDWRMRCVAARDEWLSRREVFEAAALQRTPVSPVSVVGALRRVLAPTDVVVADTGYMAAWTSALYDVPKAGRGHLRTAGSLGWALPASLGAQIAVGDARRVACVIGDGGLGYHLADIETAVRLRLPVVFAVLNNGTLAFEYQVQQKLMGTHLTDVTEFADVDYAGAARALGAQGERVDNPAEVEPALRRALASGEPTLLDIRTDRDAQAPVTNFEGLEERPL